MPKMMKRKDIEYKLKLVTERLNEKKAKPRTAWGDLSIKFDEGYVEALKDVLG